MHGQYPGIQNGNNNMCADLFFLCTTSETKMTWKLQNLDQWFLWSACLCSTSPGCSGHTRKIILCLCSVNPACVHSAHYGTAVQHICVEMSSGRNMGALYKSVSDYYVITPTESLIWVEKSYVKILLPAFWLQPQCVKNLSQDNNIWPPL